MQAASRESLAQANTRLDELAGKAGSAKLTTLANDLRGVGRLLAREPVLRRAMSDPAAPKEIRRELLDAVVGR